MEFSFFHIFFTFLLKSFYSSCFLNCLQSAVQVCIFSSNLELVGAEHKDRVLSMSKDHCHGYNFYVSQGKKATRKLHGTKNNRSDYQPCS